MEGFYEKWDDATIEDAISHLHNIREMDGYKIVEMALADHKEDILTGLPFIENTDKMRINQGIAQAVMLYAELPAKLIKEMRNYMAFRAQESETLERESKRPRPLNDSGL